jgi:hypothetical protein
MQGRNPGSTLFGSSYAMCDERLPVDSIFRILESRGHVLFRDEDFADLYQDGGRASIPTRTVATVMVLQRHLGLTDRAAVDAFAYDLRWKYAAGRLPEDTPPFNHVVLVEMRARLARSARPDRIFEIIVEEAVKLGLVGRRRVVDSTALYDAVATQDSVTLIRNAIVGLLGKLDPDKKSQLLKDLSGQDNYAKTGKPKCDWDDEEERASLLNRLVIDAQVLLAAVKDTDVPPDVAAALSLLERILGQDFKTPEDGPAELIQGVAPDRIISTVDPEARHGHKTEARHFDGYKGHIAIDPESELITATEVTAGNVGDAVPAETVLADILENPAAPGERPAEVYGDASYGTADLLEKLESQGVVPEVKVQGPTAKKGMYSQDDFDIQLDVCEARCPQGCVVPLRLNRDESLTARFGAFCAGCPKKGRCTTAKTGRVLSIHPRHKLLSRHRQRQSQPGWRDGYNRYRPRVERKFAQLMRNRHGGRRARVRGRYRVARDFAMLAAASNLNRLAKLLASSGPEGS